MSEQQIQQRIRLELSKGATRLWRNNTGALRDANGQLIRFGLCEGSSDLIGYHSIEVTPEMVGQRVAVLLAIEVKTPTGRVTSQQAAFLQHLQQAGAIAGVARSVADALALVAGRFQHRDDAEPQWHDGGISLQDHEPTRYRTSRKGSAADRSTVEPLAGAKPVQPQ